MQKIFKFKLLIKILSVLILFIQNPVFAKDLRAVSLAPNITEIIFALGGQENLVGVSTFCDYPEEAKNIKKVGNAYFVNKEEIIKLNPDYIFALSSSRPMLGEFDKRKIIYFDFNSVEDIYIAISNLSKIFDKNPNKILSDLKYKNSQYKTKNSKKILYLIQTNPYITIGQKSFITDLIKLSGNESVTSNIKYSYPVVSEEFIAQCNPDIIILSYKTDTKMLQKFYPNIKIIVPDKEMTDIINRPGIRIYKAIRFFSKL